MLLGACENAVRAARDGEDVSGYVRAAIQAVGGAGEAELTTAANLVVDASAEVIPATGGLLAVLAGALAENGADVDGIPVIERLSGIASGALAFAEVWGPQAPAAEDGPSPDIYTQTKNLLGDRARIAMQCWYALPQFAMSACTLLSLSPATRAAVADADELVDQAAEYCAQLDYVRDLRRVLDGEQLLVLDRVTQQGWSVTIHGVGDNFQLHTLLGSVLIGTALHGHPVDPRWTSSFTHGQVEPGTPPVVGWWNLADANGEWIWNEGVPADIPVVGETRVVVLDPPAYERSWSPGRRFPLMPGSLTLDATYDPADLTPWWPVLKPPPR